MWLLMACSGSGVISFDSAQETDVERIETPEGPRLVINELMARNDRTLADASGAYPDWLEIHNPNDEPVDLAYWELVVDDEGDALSGVVEPGASVLVYLSGAGNLGPDHLEMKLSAEGGSAQLIDPAGAVSDAVTWPAQAADVSAARIPDGADAWSLTATPTPGAPNEGPTPDDSVQGETEGPCGLASPEEVYFLEGDVLELPLVCENNASAEVLVVRAPPGSTATSARVEWSTGPEDAGAWPIVLATRTWGAVDEIPTAEGFTVWVADDPSHPDAVPVDPLTYTHEWALPVFHVQTADAIPESYVAATVTYEGVAYEAEIKVRGASSTSYPKKSYTLAFEDVELPVEDWPETRDRMVLVTTFDDNSYVRQKLIYDQWLAMADYADDPRMTPRAYFAVVYLNGQYHGLYTALDHVDDEFMEHMGLNRDANLYKAVNHDANFYLKSNLHAGYEKKEGVDGDWADLDALVEFTGGSSPEDLIANADTWLDLVEFMDWFLLVHYSEAADSAGKNSYLYNDPWELGFKFAPWDFNHAWGQNWYTARVPSSQLQDYSNRNAVFNAIHAVASDDLWARFDALRADEGPLSTAWIEGRLDAYYALIEPSAQRDWDKWEQDYYAFSRWASNRTGNNNWTDYQAEKAYLYTWVQERGALFQANHPE